MKNIKSISIICLTLVSCFLLNACNFAPYAYSVTGIENFRREDSNQSLNQCLLPSDSFLTSFEFEEANYYYRDEYESVLMLSGCEQSFVSLSYDEENYNAAKAFCLNEMILSDQNVFEYNGFTFIENISLPIGFGNVENGKNTNYPYLFNMFAYNDERQTLIFIGFFAGTAYENEASIALTDWGAFLDKYFSGYYDF